MPVNTVTTVTCMCGHLSIEAMLCVNNGFQINKVSWWDEMGGPYMEPVQHRISPRDLSKDQQKEIHQCLINEYNAWKLEKDLTIEKSWLALRSY